MSVRFDQYGGIGVVCIDGDLRGDDVASELRETIAAAALASSTDRVRAFVVDLGRARFVDGRGLEALLWCKAQLGDEMAAFRLAGLDANCRKIFQMTRLDERFELHPDVNAALRAMN